MNKLAIVKVGDEITGVYISPRLEIVEGSGQLEIEVIDFSKTISPWDEKTLDQIEQSKLIKVA